MHCILKWLNSQQVQQQCPMCRQEWKFKEWLCTSITVAVPCREQEAFSCSVTLLKWIVQRNVYVYISLWFALFMPLQQRWPIELVIKLYFLMLVPWFRYYIRGLSLFISRSLFSSHVFPMGLTGTVYILGRAARGIGILVKAANR